MRIAMTVEIATDTISPPLEFGWFFACDLHSTPGACEMSRWGRRLNTKTDVDIGGLPVARAIWKSEQHYWAGAEVGEGTVVGQFNADRS